MADLEHIRALKGTVISVSVEEALFDVLVVVFRFGKHVFQGALLDINKKNCPIGIDPFPAWGSAPCFQAAAQSCTKEQDDEDRYYALKQRFTYYQQPPPPTPVNHACADSGAATTATKNGRKAMGGTARAIRDQGVRMRRLRPRQVLCSQCRSICNENSENVQKMNADNAQRRRTSTNLETITSILKEPKKEPECNSVPISGVRTTRSVTDEYRLRQGAPGRMILRKRKAGDEEEGPYSVVCELPPEPVCSTAPSSPKPDENNDENSSTSNSAGVTINNKRRPVIKISFANPQGHDTVVEIPARPLQQADADASSKAAKKALKKAKKEAQRKASSLATIVSPSHGTAPSNALHHAGSSPSPLSEATSNSSMLMAQQLQQQPLRRHKHHKHHKLKRKRRHRTFSESSSNGGDDLDQDENRIDKFTVSDIRPSDGLYEEVRNNCLRQKLSISLKRLSARAYARCSPRPHSEPSEQADPSSDSGSEVPDFPNDEPIPVQCKYSISQPNRVTKPLMMRISTHSVSRCSLDSGRDMTVGDIVWGKIHGFPWWPGKVLSLSVSRRDTGLTISQQAHVSWYGSSTSSLMQCHQLAPFLLDFKIRYNRKKRGPYKEAIRQATMEAQQLREEMCDSSSSSDSNHVDDELTPDENNGAVSPVIIRNLDQLGVT